jgi:hypothetical protein
VNITNSSDAVYTWYYNGTANKTYNGVTTLNLANGQYTFIAYANDSSNNLNETSVTFVVDVETIPPYVAWVSPTNTTYELFSLVNVNITNSSDAVYTWYYNGTANTTYTGENNLNLSIGSYTFVAYANDTNNNVNSTNVTFAVVDTVAPIITVVGYSASATGATITWKTNELANSSVNYGLNVNTTSASGSSSLVLSHSISLTGLTASTFYYYNISSCDASGNCNISVQYNFTTADVVTEETVTGGTTGSGGGGPSLIKKQISELRVTPEIIEIPNGAIGLVNYKNLLLENIGDSSLSIKIKSTNLNDMIHFSETEIILGAGEMKEIDLTIIPVKEVGTYVGKIVLSTQYQETQIPVSITIKSEKSLFDVLVKLKDDQTIFVGEKLNSQVYLLQAGLQQKEDVTLNYEIKDFEGNVYMRESETIMVYKEKEFIKKFATENLPVGDYVLNVQVIYSGGIAPASAHFQIQESVLVKHSEFWAYILVLIAFAIIIFLIVLIIRYKKAIHYHRNIKKR